MMKTYIKEILNKRNNIPREQYISYSQKICESILNLTEYKNCENLLIFYPYLGEADVLLIAQKAIEERKSVFFPKVTGDFTMDFIKINDLNDFTQGYKGIFEPIGTTVFDKHNISANTLMILPGSAFDELGNRAGYGKGYYDRYLEDCYAKVCKIGVCFSIQMLKHLPDVKITDIQMDYIINEKIIVRSNKNGIVK